MVCSKFIEKYGLDEHIANINELYRKKSRIMVEALDLLCPEISHSEPEGGLFVWCTLPASVKVDDFVKLALENKVAVVPSSAFAPDGAEPVNAFRITYSTPTEEQIVKGVELLAKTYNQLKK